MTDQKGNGKPSNPREIVIANALTNAGYKFKSNELTVVSGGRSRFPDFEIDFKTHKVIIEVDQYNHSNSKQYPPGADFKRMRDLAKASKKYLYFIRFNPDGYPNRKGVYTKSVFEFPTEENAEIFVNKRDHLMEWINYLKTQRYDADICVYLYYPDEEHGKVYGL